MIKVKYTISSKDVTRGGVADVDIEHILHIYQRNTNKMPNAFSSFVLIVVFFFSFFPPVNETNDKNKRIRKNKSNSTAYVL